MTEFRAALEILRGALAEMTRAVYEGTDTDRKVALEHLVDAYADLLEGAELDR